MKSRTRVRHRAMAVATGTLMAGGMVLATGAASAVSELSPSDQQAIVSETNSLRAAAGVSALTWSSTLAASAQAWADNPASTQGGSLHHDTNLTTAAENMSGAPPNQAVSQWAAEKSAYDADPNHDPFGNAAGYQEWGHYYNMINKNWHQIGCGSKSGVPVSGSGVVTVCRYGP